MNDSRKLRAKLNIIVSPVTQIVTLLCGFISQGVMLTAFGSETNGAVASITQFLTYVMLLEGGICGVAKAVMYKPLAQNDTYELSKYFCGLKRFFRVVFAIFTIYVLILAISFHKFAEVKCMDWISTAVLVIVISISIFAQKVVGLSYYVLLQASQRTYVSNIITAGSTILNTLLVLVLIRWDCDIIIVKFFSSCVFVLRPILMWLYVKYKFKLIKVRSCKENLFPQKWAGLGQHLAFCLHSNTDIALLTVFSNLSTVSVYSVYNMITSHIQAITASFADGMEGLFGDMLAKNENENLNRTFDYYETLLSFVSTVLLSTAFVMIIPFVKLYTSAVNDANYIHPVFSLILIVSSLLFCFRIPYNSIVNAAGHFKQTQIAAYGEALINILVSAVLLIKFGLIGVAIGTLVAVLFRFIYYVIYLKRYIMKRRVSLFLKRQTANLISFVLSSAVGMSIVNSYDISNYLKWVVIAVVVVIAVFFVTVCVNSIFYREIVSNIIKKFKRGEK